MQAVKCTPIISIIIMPSWSTTPHSMVRFGDSFSCHNLNPRIDPISTVTSSMPPTVLIKDLSSEQSAGSTVLEDHDMDCYILGCFVIQQTDAYITSYCDVEISWTINPFFIAMSWSLWYKWRHMRATCADLYPVCFAKQYTILFYNYSYNLWLIERMLMISAFMCAATHCMCAYRYKLMIWDNSEMHPLQHYLAPSGHPI